MARPKDLGEPRDVSRPLRHNNRAFGSLPYQTAQLPAAPASRTSILNLNYTTSLHFSAAPIVLTDDQNG